MAPTNAVFPGAITIVWPLLASSIACVGGA
jgi:hypothetical protein